MEIDHSVKNSLVVSIEDNLLDLFKAKFENGVLTLWSEGSFSSNRGIKVILKSNSIEKITKGGSGDIQGRVVSEALTINADGSGDISLNGVANSLYIKKSGSGDFSFKDLKAAHVLVNSSGSGDISCHASMSFDGTTSGSGDVAVFGNPLKTKSKSSGSGDLTVY